MSLKNIRIVLVNPTHPGNIGAAARAMKTMCLTNLTLVAPRDFPSEEATARAVGATDILDQAVVCQSLDEALADCHVAIGTSARARRIDWPLLEPHACAEQLMAGAAQGPVALVFGRERTGLTNEELDRCQAVVTLPANPAFTSLNLAAAVQILAYEIRQVSRRALPPVVSESDSRPATREEIQGFYAHLEQVMTDSGFLDPAHPRKLMRRIYRLFNRAALDEREVNILRGILTAVQEQRILDTNTRE